jgi:hypothetical protein
VIRIIILASAIFGVINTAASGQTPGDTNANTGCIERLTLPEYPVLAKQSRIQGTITATILLSSPGSPPKIATVYMGPLVKLKTMLAVPVEEAIHHCQVSRKAAPANRSLVFHFESVGGPLSRPAQSVSFGGPNEFWITAVQPMIQSRDLSLKNGYPRVLVQSIGF